MDNVKNYGEKERGLTFNINNRKVKIYVRKWSDILEVEWGTKMKLLKEKLEIQAKPLENKTSQQVTDETTSPPPPP